MIGVYVLILPSALQLWLGNGSLLNALVLFLIHFTAASLGNPIIYQDISLVHPFLTALSIFGGMYVWGFEGIVFAPACLAGVIVAYDTCLYILNSSNSDGPFIQEKEGEK